MSITLVEVNGLYYKAGDDLGAALAEAGTGVGALRLQAEWLRESADRLSAIADIVQGAGGAITINADTHYIGLQVVEEAATQLVVAGLVTRPEDDDDSWVLDDDVCGCGNSDCGWDGR